jgi:hypothetical protein
MDRVLLVLKDNLGRILMCQGYDYILQHHEQSLLAHHTIFRP